MSGDLNADNLREEFESIWSGQPSEAEWYRKGCEPALRIHRAISWVKRAEKITDDWDKFIFYWIAFNAAYAQYVIPADNAGEKTCFDDYFDKIIKLDCDKRIHSAVWLRYSSIVDWKYSRLIKHFLDNRFTFQKFWNFHNPAHNCIKAHDDCKNWEVSFDKEKQSVRSAIDRKNTKKILCILFDRLYTLRNQIFHGGTSWDSDIAGRNQVKEGADIMSSLVPIFIYLMMEGESPESEWGHSHYPRITLEKLGLGPDEEFPVR